MGVPGARGFLLLRRAGGVWGIANEAVDGLGPRGDGVPDRRRRRDGGGADEILGVVETLRVLAAGAGAAALLARGGGRYGGARRAAGGGGGPAQLPAALPRATAGTR